MSLACGVILRLKQKNLQLRRVTTFQVRINHADQNLPLCLEPLAGCIHQLQFLPAFKCCRKTAIQIGTQFDADSTLRCRLDTRSSSGHRALSVIL